MYWEHFVRNPLQRNALHKFALSHRPISDPTPAATSTKTLSRRNPTGSFSALHADSELFSFDEFTSLIQNNRARLSSVLRRKRLHPLFYRSKSIPSHPLHLVPFFQVCAGNSSY
jgi:hypothetical protein